MNPLGVTFLSDPDECPRDRSAPCVWLLKVGHERRALLSQLVGRYLGVDPARVVFRRDAHGRLALVAEDLPQCPEAANVDVSITQSRNVFAAGMTMGGRIGVDAEVIRGDIDPEQVVRTHFSAAEQQRIASFPGSEQGCLFYKCWTAKEAFLKAIGMGVAFGLEQVETDINEGGAVRLVSAGGNRQLTEGWTLLHRDATVGGASVLVAVVFSDPGRSIRTFQSPVM